LKAALEPGDVLGQFGGGGRGGFFGQWTHR
jgi:hypothetical protein